MKRKIIFGSLSGILFAVIGLIIGMNVGGNSDKNFEFMGNVGYEATGYVGALIGLVLGAVLGVLFAWYLSKRNKV